MLSHAMLHTNKNILFSILQNKNKWELGRLSKSCKFKLNLKTATSKYKMGLVYEVHFNDFICVQVRCAS